MCAMCSDYVTSCWTCVQAMRGGKGTMGKQFYLDSTFCEHFIERYHTDSPSMYSHVEREHDWEGYSSWELPPDRLACADNCINEGWWPMELVEKVVEAFVKWGPA